MENSKLISLKTPCFVLNEGTVSNLIEEFKRSINEHFPKNIVGYSFKTNNLPWIISYMKKQGFYAETVSSDEYDLAKELGYENERIIFNGPVKGKDCFLNAVKGGSVVNIDSKRELQWLSECDPNEIKAAKIGLRVNFCIEDYCPGESQCGAEDGRFGFSYESGELEESICFLRDRNVKLSGLHMHCSSKTRSLNIYSAISKVAVEIAEKYSLELDYLDIGGGFFGGVAGKPSFDDYFKTVKKELSKSRKFDDITIIAEPGMSIIGASMDYVCTVVDKKKTQNNSFAVLDGSRLHVDPFLKKSSFFYEIVNIKEKDGSENEDGVILSGFTCMEADRFLRLSSGSINVGDLVKFKKVGAYTICLMSQFISFYPNVYVMFKNGTAKIIREKNTAKDYCKNNNV